MEPLPQAVELANEAMTRARPTELRPADGNAVPPRGQHRGASITVILVNRRCQRLRRIKRALPGQVFFGA
jgi:hypothetical protein